MAEGAQKLAAVMEQVLSVALRNNNTQMKEFFTAQMQEILLELQSQSAKLAVLEKLQAAKPKAASSRKSATTTTATTTGTAESTAPAVKETKADKPQFALNKLVWFRDEYKKSEEFRNQYTSNEFKEAMEKDPKIAEKKGESKLIAQAQFVWGKLKTDKAVVEQIGLLYKAAETAFHEANKPPQQVAEPNE